MDNESLVEDAAEIESYYHLQVVVVANAEPEPLIVAVGMGRSWARKPSDELERFEQEYVQPVTLVQRWQLDQVQVRCGN